MAKRKGVSAEEKRIRMQDIFFETKGVFQLKELEKMGAKRGVISQSVKEVLQQLVDDELIFLDKVGISNYYWCFPSQSLHQRQQKRKMLQEKRDSLAARIAKARKAQAKMQDARVEGAERTSMLARLADLRTVRQAQVEELKRFAESDPDALAAQQAGTTQALESANRWTDNLFSVVSWAVKKTGGEKKELMKGLEIPADLDYIEQ